MGAFLDCAVRVENGCAPAAYGAALTLLIVYGFVLSVAFLLAWWKAGPQRPWRSPFYLEVWLTPAVFAVIYFRQLVRVLRSDTGLSLIGWWDTICQIGVVLGMTTIVTLRWLNWRRTGTKVS